MYRPTKDRKLTDAVVHEMGARVSHWLRRIYPRDGAKAIARAHSVSPHTAKKWLAGALPDNAGLAKLSAAFGRRFVAFVFEPTIGPWTAAILDAEFDDLKLRLARLERNYRNEVDRDEDAGAPPASGPVAPGGRGVVAPAPLPVERRGGTQDRRSGGLG